MVVLNRLRLVLAVADFYESRTDSESVPPGEPAGGALSIRLLRSVCVFVEGVVGERGVVSTACSQSHVTPVLRDGDCNLLSGCRRLYVRGTESECDEKKQTGRIFYLVAG